MSGTYRAMTLTEAVKAVNEAGFTLKFNRGHYEPGKAGWFHAGAGMYEVTSNVDGLDGYVVQGTAGIVAPGTLKTPSEVKKNLADRAPKEGRQYIDIERFLDTDNAP